MLRKKFLSFALAFLLITAVSMTDIPVFIVTAEAASNVSLEDCKVTGVKNKTYTGEKITQEITVTYSGKKLEADKDYTVSYKNNKEIGTASVTIKGKSEYSGSITKTFNIRPKSVSIKDITRSENKITLTWKKVANADGYKIYYSNEKDGEYKLLKTIKDNSVLSYSSSKAFFANTEYYFYIRSYKEVDGKNYLSAIPATKKSTSTVQDVKGVWKLSHLLVGEKQYSIEEYVSLYLYDYIYIWLLDAFQTEFKTDGTVTASIFDFNESMTYEQNGKVITIFTGSEEVELWFLNDDGTELSVLVDELTNEVFVFVRK